MLTIATAHVEALEFTYQAVCPTCHWKALPTPMKHRAQGAADTHNVAWHGGQEDAA